MGLVKKSSQLLTNWFAPGGLPRSSEDFPGSVDLCAGSNHCIPLDSAVLPSKCSKDKAVTNQVLLSDQLSRIRPYFSIIRSSRERTTAEHVPDVVMKYLPWSLLGPYVKAGLAKQMLGFDGLNCGICGKDWSCRCVSWIDDDHLSPWPSRICDFFVQTFCWTYLNAQHTRNPLVKFPFCLHVKSFLAFFSSKFNVMVSSFHE